MKEWADFYERRFNFKEIRYFDIEGQVTGVKSKAMTSPCGKIRIPIHEEGTEKQGQIQAYLDLYHGAGIQHIALATDDIFATVQALANAGIRFLATPRTSRGCTPPKCWSMAAPAAGRCCRSSRRR